ncbi:phospholipase C/P1 nuclease [Schizophyllum commune Loenen D]|nr:phospholipase C/P1 nuclease [Schizophyllum commune Loenen D]
MMKHLFFVLLAFFLAAFSVRAFGTEGNQAVGYIAMQFLAPRARTFVTSSLGPQYAFSLGPAATWANAVKSQRAYEWSAELHYVNAVDTAPKYCEVDQQDCTNGRCILTAIANYTTRVVDTSLPASQRQEALKFLDSFFGDLGQPLNVEAFEHGGRDIPALCSGKQSNLYDVWDSGIITQLLKRKYSRSVARWVGVLAGRIRTGEYKDKASQWLACSSTTQPEGPESRKRAIDGESDITPLQCPLLWASESNWLVCFDVLSYTSVNPEVCTGTYYDNAVKDIEIQVAKQGYRLAAWLNVLFDGSTHLP